MTLDLDGWAVANPNGIGIDDSLRRPRLCDLRLVGRGGIVEAHDEEGTVYRLGETVWSQIGHAPAGGER